MSLAGSDADRAGPVCAAIVSGTAALCALAGGAMVLISASVSLGLVVLVGVPLVLLVSRLLAHPLVPRAEAEQETLAAATGVATDVVTGLRVIKGIGAEEAAGENYRRASRRALTARLAAVRFEGGYTAATGVITGVFLVVVAWVGAPLTLDDVVGDGADELGATLAQQLALARLVLADPAVAVLDEATAEAGSAGARRLEVAADAALAGRTAIVIAHRLAQAAAADRVVVLDKGRVVEAGPHAELLAAGGSYAALWAAWAGPRA